MTSSTSDLIWATPGSALVVAPDEIHIWRATIEVPSVDLIRIESLLSDDERTRADRFFFGHDRHRFIAARGFLRLILASYLNCSPTEILFAYSEYGKPSVAAPYLDLNLNFNLAHSGDIALYAMTLERAIGVDIEQIRHKLVSEEMARHCFSPGETTRLLSIPVDDWPQAFFDCWTRKEAFIKAKGLGLSLPLDQFEVSLAPREPALLLETRWDQNERTRWSLRAIDLGLGYAAAVAVEGHVCHARYWQATNDMLSRLLERRSEFRWRNKLN